MKNMQENVTNNGPLPYKEGRWGGGVLLVLILLLGFGIRIWGLGSAEMFHDEGVYSFRSIGYLDYIQNDWQTTPIQWFKDAPTVPWWTKLSFHDAPPLFFFVQHVFFRLFGDSLFVARLPSLIAGMFAIWLMFLIGRRFFNPFPSRRGGLPLRKGEKTREENNIDKSFPLLTKERAVGGGDLLSSDIAGLLAALFLAINHVHIWISRTSIIESLLITLILANVYFFLKLFSPPLQGGVALGEVRRSSIFRIPTWFFFGLTLGLIFLTKYTGIFLLPVYAIFLLVYRRDMLKTWHLYAAGITALLIFSPVLIYNAYLYQAVGHFDLQFAYFFGQHTPEWQASLGKIQEPFSSFIPNMLAMYSKQFLLLTIFGLGSLFCGRKKRIFEDSKPAMFLLLVTLFITLLLTKIGTAYRFIVLYAPFAAFLVVLFVLFLKKIVTNDWVWRGLVALFVVGELWFAIQGIFVEFPHLGAVDLDQYFETTFGSLNSFTQPISTQNPHLDAIIQKNAKALPQANSKKMIVYDDNIIISPKLWIFARRQYYQGTPAISVRQFKDFIRVRGAESLKDYEIFFVKANENTVVVNTLSTTTDAKELEGFLKSEFHLEPIALIYGLQLVPQGGFQRMPFFSVYKIIL